MPRLTKEQRALQVAREAAARAEQERAERAEFMETMPLRLLTMVARASKFRDRMEVEFIVEPLAVTFWDKEERVNYQFGLVSVPDRWALQDVLDLLDKYETEERLANERAALRKSALAKLTPAEREALAV